MRAVLDANPLIGLSKGGVFHLLPQLFAEIHLPRAIWQEVVVNGQGRPGSGEATAARDAGWLRITPVTVSSAFLQRHQIRGNDAHVVALAQHLAADRVVSDDRVVRRVVRSLGLPAISTAAVVVALRQLDLIESCRTVLDQMLAGGFGISAGLYDEALRLTGEL